MSIGHTEVISLSIRSKKFFYKSSTIWYAIWEWHKKVKVMLSFGLKAIISSLSKLDVKSKNFFYKTCSVWYVTWESGIKSESLAVLWSSSSHFVTFLANDQIRTFLFQRMYNLVCYLMMWHKKWKFSCPFDTFRAMHEIKFLAATSSSRSDNITLFAC